MLTHLSLQLIDLTHSRVVYIATPPHFKSVRFFVKYIESRKLLVAWTEFGHCLELFKVNLLKEKVQYLFSLRLSHSLMEMQPLRGGLVAWTTKHQDLVLFNLDQRKLILLAALVKENVTDPNFWKFYRNKLHYLNRFNCLLCFEFFSHMRVIQLIQPKKEKKSLVLFRDEVETLSLAYDVNDELGLIALLDTKNVLKVLVIKREKKAEISLSVHWILKIQDVELYRVKFEPKYHLLLMTTEKLDARMIPLKMSRILLLQILFEGRSRLANIYTTEHNLYIQADDRIDSYKYNQPHLKYSVRCNLF